MEILRASILTPDLISNDSRKPEQILKEMMGEVFSHEKLKALMLRPDVIGFCAYKLLVIARGSNFFSPILKLYTKKFILKGNSYYCLCYTMITLQLWIKCFRKEDPLVILSELKSLVLSFLKRWSEYRNSAIALFSDIEDLFIDDKSLVKTFPGDKEIPYNYDHNNTQNELRSYVLPFIGKTLVDLAFSKKYYQDSSELKALATRNLFGHPEVAGVLYIKSVEDYFLMDDIRPFINCPGDFMENFLLSNDGLKAKERFISICREADPFNVLYLIDFQTIYAGFNFKDNIIYKNFSLEEKYDFLESCKMYLKGYFPLKEKELIELWINDDNWKTAAVTDLMTLVSKKTPLFDNIGPSNEEAYLMAILLNRTYDEDVTKAIVVHSIFINELNSDDFASEAAFNLCFYYHTHMEVNGTEELRAFIDSDRGLLIALALNKSMMESSAYYLLRINNKIYELFFKHLNSNK